MKSASSRFASRVCSFVIAISATQACAGQSAYCGRILCAEAVNGCEVADGKNNPVVMIWGRELAPSKMPGALGNAIRNMDSKCGCVVGTIARQKAPHGGNFSWFASVSAAYGVDDVKCRQEGLK